MLNSHKSPEAPERGGIYARQLENMPESVGFDPWALRHRRSGRRSDGRRGRPPKYKYDGNWPKPLPNNWAIGGITGMFVDQTITSGY